MNHRRYLREASLIIWKAVLTKTPGTIPLESTSGPHSGRITKPRNLLLITGAFKAPDDHWNAFFYSGITSFHSRLLVFVGTNLHFQTVQENTRHRDNPTLSILNLAYLKYPDSIFYTIIVPPIARSDNCAPSCTLATPCLLSSHSYLYFNQP